MEDKIQALAQAIVVECFYAKVSPQTVEYKMRGNWAGLSPVRENRRMRETRELPLTYAV